MKIKFRFPNLREKWFFYNLSIAGKLIVAFLTIAIFTAGLGIVSIYYVREMAEAGQHMYEENLLEVEYVSGAYTYYEKVRSTAVMMVTTDNPTMQERYKNEIIGHFGTINGYFMR